MALLSLIMHSFTPGQDRQILATTFDCLATGGLVLISELLVNDDKTGPPPAALMSLTMLVEDEGRNYTAAEYEQWLTETGFQNTRRIPLDAPGANGLIIGENHDRARSVRAEHPSAATGLPHPTAGRSCRRVTACRGEPGDTSDVNEL